MGTRSLTFIYDESKNKARPLACMYRQYDGYPSGHGKELSDFLTPITLVNGFSVDAEVGGVANGMGCLAAQMIAHFKTDVGNIYLTRPVLNQDSWQEYEYHVFPDKIVVKRPKDVIFEGTWNEFSEFCDTAE